MGEDEEKESGMAAAPVQQKETFGSLEVVVPPESEIPPLPPENPPAPQLQSGGEPVPEKNEGPKAERIGEIWEQQGKPEAPVSPVQQQPFTGRTRILVLGAGFGGAAAARRLASKFSRADVTIVDRVNHFLFTPMMHEVAAGGLSAGSVMVPISDAASGRVGFVRGDVASIDLSGKKVKVLSGESEQDLAYDYLVVALGGSTNFFGTPGAKENCLQLKTAADAQKIREKIDGMFRSAAGAQGEDLYAKTRLVIVGGGPSGIETAGEAVHTMREASKRAGLNAGEIVLMEATERLLPGSDPRLSDIARKRLEKIGAKVRTGAKVTGVTPDGIELNGEEMIRAGAVVWVAGVVGVDVRTSPEAMRDGRSRFVVSDSLQVAGYPDVFVIGDCAAVEGKQYPPTARVALQQARLAADNIRSLASKRPLKGFEYRHPGDLMTVGPWYATMKFGGLVLHGAWVWVLWRLVYLSKIAGTKTRLSVLRDWLFGRQDKV